VPLLVIPHQFEQLLNARIVAAQGAGIALDQLVFGKSITADDLRRGADGILTKQHFRDGAANARAILRATGGYRQAADEIQAFVARAG
jgi:UDP:flavonoid glycosyltransferase YjiC (YdhE family)